MKVAALFAFAAAATLSPATPAQDKSAQRCLEELNRDVWRPFMEGVRRDDESLYLAIRSKEYVRVASSDRFILDYSDYVDDTVKMMRRYREQGTRLAVELRFEERICDGKSASEKGISRVLFTAKDGTVRTYFGRFQTISRKEGAAWRVLTDYFPPGNDVGEEQFQRAKGVDDLADFRCYMTYPDKELRCDS